MAKSKIPDPLERRHLVERALPPAQALRIAEAYLEQQRVLESIDFLRKAEARDRLSALREQAVAEGDVFLLRAVTAALAEAPDPSTWRSLAEAAAAAGKQRYAADARRQVAHGEE